MNKVKESFESGVTLANAVKARLIERGTSLSRFAVKHSVDRNALASGLSGNRALNSKEIAALIAEFGGTEEDWRALAIKEVQRRLAPVTA